MNGRTLLMFAAIENRLDSVKLLLQAGAEVRITDSIGCSGLQCYVLKHERLGNSEVDTEMVRLLHAAGERKEAVNEEMVRHLAIQHDPRRMISVLNDYTTKSNIDLKLIHQHLQHDDLTLFLKDICRRAIREHLLQMSRVNLFFRVPRLGLSSSLAKYLLYDVSLESQ